MINSIRILHFRKSVLRKLADLCNIIPQRDHFIRLTNFPGKNTVIYYLFARNRTKITFQMYINIIHLSIITRLMNLLVILSNELAHRTAHKRSGYSPAQTLVGLRKARVLCPTTQPLSFRAFPRKTYCNIGINKSKL